MRGRSPCCQRASWSSRSVAISSPFSPSSSLRMVDFLQPEAGRDAVQCPRQFLAQGVGPGSPFAGDVRPLAAESTLISKVALLVAQQSAYRREEVLAGDNTDRVRLTALQPIEGGVCPHLDAALIAATSLLPAGLVEQLVAGHRQQ